MKKLFTTLLALASVVQISTAAPVVGKPKMAIAKMALGSAKPDASNTGVIAGVPLASHAGNYLADNGAVLKNTWVHGNLYIIGHNVIIDNVKVDGDIMINGTEQGGLRLPVPSNVRLHRVEGRDIFSNGFNGLVLDGLNLHDPINAPHTQLWNYADPSHGVVFPAINLVLKNSWFHGFIASTTTAHLENVHTNGIKGALFKNNVFEIYVDANTLGLVTANFTMEPSHYGVFSSSFTLDGNWFGGGGYFQVYINAIGKSKVINNKFMSDSPHYAGIQYDPGAYTGSAVPPGGYVKFFQAGNTLNGAPVSLPGGL